jgi:hypothetical protein
MTTFNSCWVGDRLLPIANACINSFDAHGFHFRLYTYGRVRDVPRFVECCDASAVVPADRVFTAHGGLETFADLFAYRFLEKVGGWWVDNDVVCNSSAPPDVDIAFAEERPGIVNNAVLKFPPAHPVILDLLTHIEAIDPVTSPWGSTGPLALSAVLRKHQITGFSRTTSDFYPLHWREAAKFLFPEFTEEVLARTAHSPFVHLWGAALRELRFDFRRSRPLRHSYLDLIYARYLDAEIAATLEPLDEGSFRRSVKAYVEEHWRVTLPVEQ